MLVPSSRSAKAGPFRHDARIMWLIIEATEELKRMVFEVSVNVLSQEWCKINERIPNTRRRSWLHLPTARAFAKSINYRKK